METTYVVRWGERVYGPFSGYADALKFVDTNGRDLAEKRMAHIIMLESPSVLA